MSQLQLGHTLLIANPTSHSGRGAQAAEHARTFFKSFANATSSFDMELTRSPLDAVEMAAHAADMDTVIALGGDGLIHEVVNGLMAIDDRDRPRLGIIPMGSGNDFARTLGSTFNKPQVALGEIFSGHVRKLDLGLVRSNDVPMGPAGTDGTYFMETLSFGLDAAIAIDTTFRRAAGTNQEGSTLFLTSSIKMVAAGSSGYPSQLIIEDDEQDLLTVILAVQIGPTYGGGFRVCPAASPVDGLLDVCYNVRKPWMPHMLALLALLRFGRHTRSRMLRLEKTERLIVDFPDRPAPCQIDGEELLGSHFEIEVVPQALDVIVPARCIW